MNLLPKHSFGYFLRLMFVSFLLILSCSKDTDTLLDAVLNEEGTPIVEQESTTTDQNDSQEQGEEEETEGVQEEELESRTTVFPVINDAYLQNGKGYNQTIVRLQENFRRSYLMFDLSEIDSIGGSITSGKLEFIINQDDGNGIIKIYRGTSNNWAENSLSEKSAPKIAAEIGKIEQSYKVGEKVTIDLDGSEILPEFFTLILEHKNGNDLAFASKENKTTLGPKLVVTYDAPIDANQIVIADEQIIEETEEDTAEEDTTEEDTTEEETNIAPTAVAAASPSSGEVPLEVTFTGSDSSDDNAITEYTWNFKDGTTSSSTNTKHTFTEAGNYDVTLSVTDAEGLTSTDMVTIAVTEEGNSAPSAKANASVTSGKAPLRVTFNGSSSTDDNSIEKYTWNFESGATSNSANPVHTFNSPGTYNVELTVEDEEGLTDKDTVTITVNEEDNAAPSAKASASVTSGDAPLRVTFNGSSSTDDISIEKYTWNFESGATSNSANPVHTFNSPGTYNVELTVEDEEGLTDKDTVTITVNEKSNEAPSAKASASVTSGNAPLRITFNGSSSTDDNSIEKYTWNFESGATSNNANPVHTFNSPGTYNVELTVEDEEGLTDNDTVTITVNAQPNEAPTAVAFANTLSGDAPLNVNFRGSDSSDDKGISTYFWDIPGNPSTSANPTRTFDTPGVYNITLTVTDEEGLQGSDTLTITVNQAPTGTTGGSQIPCSVGGGMAGDTGAKIWCWENINVPSGEANGRDSFSNGQLALNIECNTNQVVREGNRLKFQLNPTNPSPASWCSNNYNMRAEIRTMPWKVNQPLGTEEWIGWSYTFGDNYKIDSENPWLFFQMQQGVPGSPPIELAVVPSSLYGANNGESGGH